MLDIFNNNSPLINTLIVYLFIMYVFFINEPNIKNEVFVVFPTIIYSFFVFCKINNK